MPSSAAHVKLAAIGHVSNVLGCVNPVEKVIEMVHRKRRCGAGRCRTDSAPHDEWMCRLWMLILLHSPATS